MGILDKNGLLDKEVARKIKWNNATNMSTRMKNYHSECRGYYRTILEIVSMVTVAMIVVAFLLSTFCDDFIFDSSFWIKAGLIYLFMIPIFIIQAPKRPTEVDILNDQALRRQVGMDDSVEDMDDQAQD